MGDANNADIKWFYAQDDELTMGILEALQDVYKRQYIC